MPEDDRLHLIRYRYNDIASLDAAVAEAGDDLAGIFATAYKYDAFVANEAVAAAFACYCRAVADRHRSGSGRDPSELGTMCIGSNGELEKAIKASDTALLLTPDDPQRYMNAALPRLDGRIDLEGALMLADAGMQLAPDHGLLHDLRGHNPCAA